MGSGNIVHNLCRMTNDTRALPWAISFEVYITKAIHDHDIDAILTSDQHPSYPYAVPTPEHFIPLLYILALQDEEDEVEAFNEEYVFGSLSMHSYIWSSKE